MSLVTVESSQRLSCISQLINSADGSGLAGEYLTSLSDYQKEGTYIWCNGNNTVLENLTWTSGQPSGISATGQEEDCGSITLGPGPMKSNVLNDVICATSLNYICEVPVTTTTKPPCLSYTCAKQASFLDANDFINPSSPIDGSLRIACGRMYFFSNAQKTWQEAASECCLRNMQLLSIEDAAETMCLATMLAKSNYGFGGTSWFTAGSDEFHEGQFTWCTANTATNISSGFRWNAGEPNNDKGTENCIQMIVGGGSPPENVNFNDVNCGSTIKFICETSAPPCQFPQCPSVPCRTDVEKSMFSKLWLSNPGGLFRSACGRQYFISKGVKTRNDAETECCKFGMRLLSIESYEELQCLAEMNKVQYKSTVNYYWTTGTNEGFGCEFQYGFCGTQTSFNPNFLNWKANEPSTPLGERCLEMKLDVDPKLFYFNDNSCSATQYFICEGDQADCTPTCPNHATCVKDNSLFNSKGELIRASSYGRWATGSGKTYLFATNKIPWAAAYDMCCKLGMDLLSVDSDLEMKTIFDLNNNDPLLKFNTEFWTSGTQLDCSFRFKYCSSGTTFYANDSNWNAGEPNNANEQEACVLAHFGPSASYDKSQAWMQDVVCTDSYGYICEMPAKPCISATCYDYNCTVDPVKTSQVTAMTGPDGQFQTFCGQKYFFHKDMKTYKDAYYECCKFGMKLVSIETNAERECLHDGFKFAGWGSLPLWTSGTSDGVGCVRNFGWCPSGTLVAPDLMWRPGEPNSPYVENCMNLYTSTGAVMETGLNDIGCDAMLRFLCE
ncbi:macrophage mannose receptor 1-like [Cloeon dipterum]|uniref:macrophage mannose receptor 1-like n=1 Tax=Cloeon dipterum TaxID=197152 RepID=UPI00321F7302